MSSADRIEKKVLLKASRSRVWRAITDVKEFGAWFQVKLESPFVAGTTVSGQLTYPAFEHLRMEMQIEQLRPETYFSYRWHPDATDPKLDYSPEPTTLVEFSLSEGAGGILLTIVESGFDALPAARRETALRLDDHGWTQLLPTIQKYVAQP